MFNETPKCSPCLVEVNSMDEGTGALSINSTVSKILQPPTPPPVSHTEGPEYMLQGVWWLAWLVCLEYLALWWQGERLPNLHDNILSLAHATLYEVSKFFVRGLEYGVYVWVWGKYALLPAPGDTLLSFLFMVVLVDFGFYWLHRAAHEIMVLWAIHQVHHSSEEYSVAVGLRHSPLQRLFSWIFYLPLALLGIPPAHMLMHIQFNTLFQCWTHTKAIKTVGPLEYILNTPSHHRVHHGCNLYCLDKNYGGIFIIWDRLFGTFQPELPDQEIVYGIVFQPEFFNPIYHQFFYMVGAFKKAQSMSSWKESLCALVKGPSWAPGSPWTGWVEDKMDIKGPRDHIPVAAVTATHSYVIMHFWIALTLTSYLVPATAGGPVVAFVYSMMVVATLTCIGILYENSPSARVLEVCRCGVSLTMCLCLPLPSTTILSSITTIYAASLVLWVMIPDTIMGRKIH